MLMTLIIKKTKKNLLAIKSETVLHSSSNCLRFSSEYTPLYILFVDLDDNIRPRPYILNIVFDDNISDLVPNPYCLMISSLMT